MTRVTVWLFLGALASLLLLIPVVLTAPALALGVVAGAVLLIWLMKQGRSRFALGLLTVMMLGAASTVEAWVSVAAYGRVVAVILVLILVFVETSNLTPRKTRPQRAIIALLYGIVLVAFISTLWSFDPGTTLTQSALLLALVLTLQRLTTRRWLERVQMVQDLRVVVTLVNLVLAAGIVAHFSGLLPTTFTGRFQGLLNNPNMASQVAILAAFLGWGLFRERPSVWRLLSIIPAVATLVLSESRTGIVALAIGGLWILIRSGVRGLVAAATIATAALVYVTTFGSGVFGAVLERFGRVEAGDTLSGRSFIWEYAVALAEQQPIGWGWGATDGLLKGMYQTTGSGTATGSIHNSYLQTLVEGGVVALGLVILIYLVMLVPLFKTRVTGVAAGLSGAVIAGAVGQFAESGIFGVGQIYPYLYWFSVAGLLAVYATRGVTTESNAVAHQTYRTKSLS